MKNRVFAIILSSIAMLLFVSGCAKSPEEKLVDLMNEYTDIIVSNENDCAAAGKKIDAFVDKNKAEFTKLMSEAIKNNKDKKEAADKMFAEKMKGADEAKIKAITEKCGSDETFVKAQMKFGMMMLSAAMGGAGEAIGEAMKDTAEK